MKTFKLIDFWLQAIVIAVCLILTVARTFSFYVACFIVSGMQFTSIVIHEAAGFFTNANTARREYHNIIYSIVLCMIIGIWLRSFLFIFVALLFLAPFIAAYYLRLCYKETYVYLKRPLSILK